MTQAWESNADISAIARRIGDARRVAIFTHAKPDGDAIGSTLALARTLTRLGKHAVPVYLNPWPDRFDPIVGDTPIIKEHRDTFAEEALQEIDLAVILDTGSWNQLADARAWLEPRADHTIIIDHHAHGEPEIAEMRLIDTSAAAAAEIAAELCAQLLGVPTNKLPVEVAEPLYLGIATDTGFFRYSSVTPGTMRLAAALIDAGVEHNALYRLVEQSDDVSRLRLITRSLNNMTFHAGDTVAVIAISQKDAEECGVSMDDVGGLGDLPQSVASVRAVAVLTELEADLTKVSFRSKAGKNHIDVNQVAQQFGGGGHVHAAGAKIHEALDSARARVIAALEGAAR